MLARFRAKYRRDDGVSEERGIFGDHHRRRASHAAARPARDHRARSQQLLSAARWKRANVDRRTFLQAARRRHRDYGSGAINHSIDSNAGSRHRVRRERQSARFSDRFAARLSRRRSRLRQCRAAAREGRLPRAGALPARLRAHAIPRCRPRRAWPSRRRSVRI